MLSAKGDLWGCLTLLKFDLQFIWDVRRGGWVTGLRIEVKGGPILQRGKTRDSWCHGHNQHHQHPRKLSRLAPIPIPKQQDTAITAQSSTRAQGALGTKGTKKSDNFSPQLDLIFFFDAPTAGGGIAAEKQVRQGKVRLFAVSAE